VTSTRSDWRVLKSHTARLAVMETVKATHPSGSGQDSPNGSRSRRPTRRVYSSQSRYTDSRTRIGISTIVRPAHCSRFWIANAVSLCSSRWYQRSR
jgi:hypothetical protein